MTKFLLRITLILNLLAVISVPCNSFAEEDSVNSNKGYAELSQTESSLLTNDESTTQSANPDLQDYTNFQSGALKNSVDDENCDIAQMKTELKTGWYSWMPYQYYQLPPEGNGLTGMDIELVKAIASAVDVNITNEEVDWKVHQQDLREGKRDFASGATYTDERSKFVYFSVPYRYEENSLFVLKNGDKKLVFHNVQEFLAQVRLLNFRLGVIDGFVYADSRINEFLKDASNRDIVYKVKDDSDNLHALLKDNIDGFLSDRLVGSALVMKEKVGSLVVDRPLHIQTPIHLMFSKKTIPVDLVEKFNSVITKFKTTEQYKKIVRDYLYPVLLMQTINSEWFYYVNVIGIIAFAFSGVAIAAKDNMTLFGAFMLALLPSVGGGMIRDILLNADKVRLFINPLYIYLVIATVFISFLILRLLSIFNKNANNDEMFYKFWNHLFIISDSLGQASFVVTGVSIAIMAKMDPIELWGPFFGLITANAGGMIRDLFTNDKTITALSGEINAEVSLLLGLAFSIFLQAGSNNPSIDTITTGVITTVVCGFFIRIFTIYFNVKNIRMKSN